MKASELPVPLAQSRLRPREQVHRLDICDAKPVNLFMIQLDEFDLDRKSGSPRRVHAPRIMGHAPRAERRADTPRHMGNHPRHTR